MDFLEAHHILHVSAKYDRRSFVPLHYFMSLLHILMINTKTVIFSTLQAIHVMPTIKANNYPAQIEQDCV